jgi:hypothetical protein
MVELKATLKVGLMAETLEVSLVSPKVDWKVEQMVG